MNESWYGLGLACLILVGAFVLTRLTRYLLDQFISHLVNRTQTDLDNVVVQAIEFPLRAAILVGSIQVALYTLAIYSLTPITWGWSINTFFLVIYVIIAYVLLFRLIGGLVEWYAHTYVYTAETRADDQFLAFFRHLAYIVLTTAAVIIVLSRMEVEVSALVTTLGIGSLAIALAAQATLGDMIAGFMIVIDRPFRVGDRVEVMDIKTWGDVVEVGLRSTRILTRDNRLVSVPNSVIGKGLVVNYSIPNSCFRVETRVSVAYGTDLEYARRVIIEAICHESWVMADRPIEALFIEFGESALVFRVRCWIEHFIETRRVIDKMNTAIYQALRREGIVIPFPQRDLHLRTLLPSDKEPEIE
jgi:MscS family membrane protein